jgi:hypothetical protein
MIIPPILVIERTLRDAGLPIDGVSVGSPLDRTTWKAFYQASATGAQKAQGDALLLTLDPQDPTVVAEIKADFATGLTNHDELIAMTQAIYAAIPNPLLTLTQVRAQFLATLKARL